MLQPLITEFKEEDLSCSPPSMTMRSRARSESHSPSSFHSAAETSSPASSPSQSSSPTSSIPKPISTISSFTVPSCTIHTPTSTSVVVTKGATTTLAIPTKTGNATPKIVPLFKSMASPLLRHLPVAPITPLGRMSNPLANLNGSIGGPSANSHHQLLSNSGNPHLLMGTAGMIENGKALLSACRTGDKEEVKTLLGQGAPFSSDWLGSSPLHFACQFGHLEVLEMLLKSGVSRDTRTKVDRTPLHLAVMEGHMHIVNCLIDNGCDINPKDMLKMTPIMWAANFNMKEIAEVLLYNGADVTPVSKFDRTAIDIAQRKGHQELVTMLREEMDSGKYSKANKGNKQRKAAAYAAQIRGLKPIVMGTHKRHPRSMGSSISGYHNMGMTRSPINTYHHLSSYTTSPGVTTMNDLNKVLPGLSWEDLQKSITLGTKKIKFITHQELAALKSRGATKIIQIPSSSGLSANLSTNSATSSSTTTICVTNTNHNNNTINVDTKPLIRLSNGSIRTVTTSSGLNHMKMIRVGGDSKDNIKIIGDNGTPGFIRKGPLTYSRIKRERCSDDSASEDDPTQVTLTNIPNDELLKRYEETITNLVDEKKHLIRLNRGYECLFEEHFPGKELIFRKGQFIMMDKGLVNKSVATSSISGSMITGSSNSATVTTASGTKRVKYITQQQLEVLKSKLTTKIVKIPSSSLSTDSTGALVVSSAPSSSPSLPSSSPAIAIATASSGTSLNTTTTSSIATTTTEKGVDTVTTTTTTSSSTPKPPLIRLTGLSNVTMRSVSSPSSTSGLNHIKMIRLVGDNSIKSTTVSQNGLQPIACPFDRKDGFTYSRIKQEKCSDGSESE